MDKVEAAKDLKGDVEDKMGMLENVRDLGMEVVGLPMEPVSGPICVRLLYVLCACGAIGYGAFNVYESATGPWKEHVTEVDYSVENELEYPDLYLCLPARWVNRYTDGPDGRKIFLYGGSSETMQGAIRSDCDDATSPARVKALDGKTMGEITGTKSDTCPWKGAHGLVGKEVGCVSDADCLANTYTAPTDDAAFNARLTALIDSLPTFTPEGSTTPVKGNCLGFPAKKGAAEKRSEKGQYLAMWNMKVNKVDNENPIFEAYLAEPGTDPVDSSGNLLATPVVFGGFSTVGIAQLTIDMIKDEPKGDKRYHPVYRYNMWTKTLFTGDATETKLEFDKGTVGFVFESFTVRKIHIRNKTWAEIYADLGGIWAASVALLMLFWAKSGHVDARRHRETYIFRYLPGGVKRRFLRESAKLTSV